MQLTEILAVGDELNLYLVVNGLKPATIINLSSFSSSLNGRVKNEELDGGVRYVTFYLDPSIVDYLRKYLDDLGLKYKDLNHENIAESWGSQGEKIMHEVRHDHAFYVSSNQVDLERLISAKDDRERGLALGFPVESVEAYKQVIDGERRGGHYVPVALAKAKQLGMELPTWLAYISFIPEMFDLINGKISSSSQQLAERYQHFVKQHNPDLANRIEQHFLDRKLPDRWEKARDGGYACEYDFKPS